MSTSGKLLSRDLTLKCGQIHQCTSAEGEAAPRICALELVTAYAMTGQENVRWPRKLTELHEGSLRSILCRLSGTVALVPELRADILAVNADVGAPGSAPTFRLVSICEDVCIHSGDVPR